MLTLRLMMVVGAWQYSTFLSATVNTATSVQSTPGNRLGTI